MALAKILRGCSTEADAHQLEPQFKSAFNKLYGRAWVRFRRGMKASRRPILGSVELTEAIKKLIAIVNEDPRFANFNDRPITYAFGQRIRTLGNLCGDDS
jgi:hypothetical protein